MFTGDCLYVLSNINYDTLIKLSFIHKWLISYWTIDFRFKVQSTHNTDKTYAVRRKSTVNLPVVAPVLFPKTCSITDRTAMVNMSFLWEIQSENAEKITR